MFIRFKRCRGAIRLEGEIKREEKKEKRGGNASHSKEKQSLKAKTENGRQDLKNRRGRREERPGRREDTRKRKEDNGSLVDWQGGGL